MHAECSWQSECRRKSMRSATWDSYRGVRSALGSRSVARGVRSLQLGGVAMAEAFRVSSEEYEVCNLGELP